MTKEPGARRPRVGTPPFLHLMTLSHPQVPAYTFPKNREGLAALRVVVRRGFTHDMADLLVADLERQLARLEQQAAPVHDEGTAAGVRR